MRATSLFRHSMRDGVLVALALVHGALLIAAPSAPLVAIGLWWNANTVSHNFIHLPFFRARRLNDGFALYLTLLLGFPQHLWRARHLAHHAGRELKRVRWTGRIVLEAGLVGALWMSIAFAAPKIFFFAYLPGYLIGLGLCSLQGHFEHAYGTTSHYGRAYNTLFFNDGFHVEHHATPSTHWSRLRATRRDAASASVGHTNASRWPPVFRWLDEVPAVLDGLERLVLRSPRLQRAVLRAHERAIGSGLATTRRVERVTVIGGGLFPRTAIILQRLRPTAAITVIDRSPQHLAAARRWLGGAIDVIAAECRAGQRFDADVLIVPLAFIGDRDAFYRAPPASVVLVHDWIWRRRGESYVVAWWLLKRVNVVRAPHRARSSGAPPRPSASMTPPASAA